MPSTGHYPIERREGEIERLRMQAAAIEFDASVMLDRIGVGSGWRCLDLGCGPGGIIELLSLRAGPTGRVIALDADPVFLEQARVLARERGLGNVDFVQGDAYCTGLARGSFELVHARFVASIAESAVGAGLAERGPHGSAARRRHGGLHGHAPAVSQRGHRGAAAGRGGLRQVPRASAR